jgi:hypothetical protein
MEVSGKQRGMSADMPSEIGGKNKAATIAFFKENTRG